MRYIFLLLATALFACGPKQQEQTPALKDTTIIIKDTTISVPVDTIGEYLPANKDTLRKIIGSAKVDSLDKKGFFEDFTYLKVGNLLSKDYRSAILISDARNDKYNVEIFNNTQGTWAKAGQNTIGELFISQLAIDCRDYNFDGQTDIYIQASVSNGVAISRGYLLTQNAKGGFTYHPECRDVGDMEPDGVSQIVKSREYIMCDNGENTACKITNKWQNNKLVQVAKKCPCKEQD